MRVAIIGAGITGLYLAWKLAEKGEEITVFEKKNKIGKEACSCLVSERILEFIPQSQNLIQNQIDYCLINFPRKTIKIEFSKRFFAINRPELDNLVKNLAEKVGAKIILNHEITRSDLVMFQEGFDKVIGCDGVNSEIRKKLRLREPQFRLGIQGFIAKNDNSKFIETWPAKSGFLWKIPRGKETEYGIIEKSERARKLFEEFLKIKGIKLERINSAIVPQGLIIPSHPKITLCGDAAGLTKPWSGGGVIWGLTAAEILLKYFPDFVKYHKELKKFFLPKIIFSKIAMKTIYFLGFKMPWLLFKNYKIESDFLT